MNEFQSKTFTHGNEIASYSSDMAPANFFLFPKFNSHFNWFQKIILKNAFNWLYDRINVFYWPIAVIFLKKNFM